MKKNFLNIIVAASLLWTTAVALAGTANVVTTDFQGTVTTNATNTTTSESRNGVWTGEDGSIFSGNAYAEKYVSGNTTSHKRYKNGNLSTATFQGTAYLYETQSQIGNTTASLSRTQRHSGKWYLAPASRLSGTITVTTLNNSVTVVDNRTAF